MTGFEASSLPHPADVLDEFSLDDLTQLEHLRFHHNLVVLPDHPDVLLRWFPFSHQNREQLSETFGVLTEDTMHYIQARQADHMRQLQTNGTEVVEHISWVGKDSPTIHGQPTWYSTVRRLKGKQLGLEDPRGNDVPASQIEYLTAARHGADKVFMHDVNLPRQYTIDNEPDSWPVLHDIEPRFMPVSHIPSVLRDPVFESWIECSVYNNDRRRAVLARQIADLRLSLA